MNWKDFFGEGFKQHFAASAMSDAIFGLIFTKNDKGEPIVKPEIRQKLAPGFLGLSSADEKMMGSIRTKLTTSELNVLNRLELKLLKHQKVQFRLFLTGIQNIFTMEDALTVLRMFINVQEDDDDSVKIKILLLEGIITEKDPLQVIKEKAGPIWEQVKKAKKAGDNFNNNFVSKIINPLQSLNKKLKDRADELSEEIKNG